MYGFTKHDKQAWTASSVAQATALFHRRGVKSYKVMISVTCKFVVCHCIYFETTIRAGFEVSKTRGERPTKYPLLSILKVVNVFRLS